MIGDCYNAQNECSSGLSIVEVLVAALILSITILGLIRWQTEIVTQLTNQKKQLLAERIAFQILDTHPDNIEIKLLNQWHYRITRQYYTPRCEWVSVTIEYDLNNRITQRRLYC